MTAKEMPRSLSGRAMAALLLVGGFFSSSPPLHIDKTETKDQLYSLNHKMTKEELQQERSYSSNMTKEELEQELEEMFVGREPLRKTLIDIFIWAQDLRDRQEIDNSTIRRTLMHTAHASVFFRAWLMIPWTVECWTEKDSNIRINQRLNLKHLYIFLQGPVTAVGLHW